MPEFLSHVLCFVNYLWKRMVGKPILCTTEQSKYLEHSLTLLHLVFSKKLCVVILFKLMKVLFCWRKNNLASYVHLYSGHKTLKCISFLLNVFEVSTYFKYSNILKKTTKLTFQI